MDKGVIRDKHPANRIQHQKRCASDKLGTLETNFETARKGLYVEGPTLV